LQCCESTAEERSAGNPHATFCGSGRRATASRDPVALSNGRPYRVGRSLPNLTWDAGPGLMQLEADYRALCR